MYFDVLSQCSSCSSSSRSRTVMVWAVVVALRWIISLFIFKVYWQKMVKAVLIWMNVFNSILFSPKIQHLFSSTAVTWSAQVTREGRAESDSGSPLLFKAENEAMKSVCVCVRTCVCVCVETGPFPCCLSIGCAKSRPVPPLIQNKVEADDTHRHARARAHTHIYMYTYIYI